MSKKGVVQKMLYGNKEEDFNDYLLPKTRKEQFGYIFKNNWLKLFSLNILMFIFFVPAIIYFFVSAFNYTNIVSNMTIEEVYQKLFSLNLMRYLILTGLIMIGFIGLSGGSFIIRKLVFDEAVSFKEDFIKGIKYSAKQFLAIGLFLGLTIFAFNYSEQYIMLSKMNPFTQIMLVVMLLIVFILLVISVMYMINLSNLYVMKFSAIFKSGLVLTFKNLFKNLLVFIIAFLPVFGWLIFASATLKFVMVFVLFVIGVSYIMLLFTLISMYSFDIYINPVQYPDFVRKGLSKDE